MKKCLGIACAVALGFTAGSVLALDNTGTGGTITYTDSNGANPAATPWPGGYVVHTFTNSGSSTLTIPTAVTNASVLVVAGGGGGGANGGGGGGAGGLIYSNANMSISAGSTAVTVGSGGAACINNNYAGSSGSNSTFSTLTAVGGGGGGSRDGGKVGLNGGSGGGGGSSASAGGTGTSGQGFNGGAGVNTAPGYGGGGGGGAGAGGINGTGSTGGNGGIGKSYTITGITQYYAGGAGGGLALTGTPGTGGLGGGGAGGNNSGSTAQSGGANTGGGGGAGGPAAGNGGSGIVIVRYSYDPGMLSVTVTAPANGQQILPGSSVSATVSVASGQSPYTVTFYTNYNGGVYGPAGTASEVPYTVNLGTLADGTYSFYADVTDSALSNAISATNTFTVAPDTTPPTPDPMYFAVNPVALDASTVVMTAMTATDTLSSSVEYYFLNTTNGINSGWITSTVWTNTGLTLGTTYGYQVKARDSATVKNETGFSAVFNAIPAAQTITWDANTGTSGAQDGTGNWLDANRWWNGSISADVNWNNSPPNSAVIGSGSAGGAITLGAVTAGSVTFTNFTGTYTLTGGSLTQSSGITVAANAGAVTIDTLVAGSGGIVKNGSSTLTLSGANTFTGGTVINAGTLIIGADGNLGNTSGGITFTGTATLQSSIATLSLPATRTITLNNGAIATFYFNVNSNPKSITINGKITGNGGITLVDAYILGGNSTMNLNNTANDFTGSLNMGGTSGNNVTTYNVASLADGAGYGNIIFGKANGAATFNYTGSSALTLNSGGRRIELASTTAGNTFNSSGSGVITVNTDLLISGTGAKTFTLGGSNTGVNTFAGKIANGSSAVSLTKADGGTWILAGTNTYSGGTTLSAGILNANATSALGSGNVTVSAGTLLISVPGTMTNTASLYLPSVTGKNITLNANLNVAKLFIAGVQQPNGTYSSSGAGSAWMNNGSGILTVGSAVAYWDLNDTTAGACVSGATAAGTWDSGAKWNSLPAGTDTTVAWTAGQTAAFAAGTDATGAYIVAVDGMQDIGGLNFEEGTVTLSGGTALRLVSDLSVYVATASQTSTVATTISEDVPLRALTKFGSGTLVLSGANTFSGATTLSVGTLQLANTNAIGSSGSLSLATGTTMDLRCDTSAVFNTPLGILTSSGAASTTFNVDNNGSGAGNMLTLKGGLKFVTAAGGNSVQLNIAGNNNGYVLRIPTLQLLPNVTTGLFYINPTTASVNIGTITSATLADANLYLRGSGTENSVDSIEIAGKYSQYIYKDTAATWTVGNVAWKTRDMTISAGKLIVTGRLGGATSGGNLLFTGGTLAGTGSVEKVLTVPAVARIAPGNPTGTMTVTNCTINGTLEININGALAGKLAVTNLATLTIGASAVLDVNVTATPIQPVVIATYGSGKRTGTFASNDLPGGWTISYGATAIVLTPPPAGTIITFF